MKNIINEFWEHVEENKNKKYIEKIYKWLNRDNLTSIIIDNNIYWLEKTCSLATIPNYAYNYIKKFMKKKGYTYLYDMSTNINILSRRK